MVVGIEMLSKSIKKELEVLLQVSDISLVYGHFGHLESIVALSKHPATTLHVSPYL